MSPPETDGLTLTGLTVPAIPPCRLEEQWTRGEHLLFWVHTGEAHVTLADGERFDLRAGDGIWVPAHLSRSVQTELGCVALPILIQPYSLPSAPETPVPFTAPDGWRDWLIQHYVHRVTPITSRGYAHTELLTLLPTLGLTSTGRPSTSDMVPDHDPATRLPMPASVTARIVAAELLRNPALGHTVEQWADLVATSPRTLRRDFHRGTGMTFTRWRTRCRLAAAADLLAGGYAPGWVAGHVGFGSRNGLTRAFRTEHDQVPSAVVAAFAEQNTQRPQRVRAAIRGTELDVLIGFADTSIERTVPATYSPPVTYPDEHVLLWNYKGSSWVRVGERSFDRTRGDAIWMPAGIPHETRQAADCIDVPIGTVFSSDLSIDEPLQVRFPRSWDDYLLYCSVARYTMLRPENYEDTHILTVFDEHLTLRRAQSVPMPRHPAGREAATQFLRSVGTPVHPGRRASDTGLDDIFRQETGMSLTTWQRATRMRIARDLLANGTKPGSVAGRVGYTHLSAFTRAFTRYHGIPPRAYQRNEANPR